MMQLGRIIESGIPAIDIYAEAMGIKTEEVSSAISKGKISATQFMDIMDEALANGTTKFPALAGAAKEAGSSWQGSFDNMKAAVTRGVVSIVQSIDDMLKDSGLPDMRSMVSNFGSTFEGVLNKAAGVVPRFKNALVGTIDYVRPGFNWLKDTAIPAVKNELVNAYEAAKLGLEWLKDVALPGVANSVESVIEKAASFYSYIKDNWSLIGPVVAGVAGTIAAFKAGVVAVTTAQSIWKGVTTGVQIATALLNGTLAISPLGWVALAIGAVVAAGVLLWQNWDTVKEKGQQLWEKMKEVGSGIQNGWNDSWNAVKSAAETAINGVIDGINSLIETINKIPGVNIPIVAKVDWTSAEVPDGASAVSASYAVGTNRVPYDMVAQIHKDEMIVPAVQSRNLRRQGVTIDNIDQARPQPRQNTQIPSSTPQNQGDLLSIIATLIQAIKSMPKGDVYVQIDGHNKSVNEIVNELIPLLKLRLANL